MIRVASVVLTSVLIALAALFLVLSLGLSPVGRLLPLPVAALTLVLLSIEASRLLFFPRRTAESEVEESYGVRNATNRNEWDFVAWLSGFYLSVFVLGLAVAGGVFLALYLRMRAFLRPGPACLAGLLTAGALHGLFDRLLGVSLPSGWLPAWLGWGWGLG